MLGALLALAVLGPLLWAQAEPRLSAAAARLGAAALAPLSFLPEARAFLGRLGDPGGGGPATGHAEGGPVRPEAPPPPGAGEILRFAGGYYRYLFLWLAGVMCLAMLRRDPGRVFRRELGMWTLLENNARSFPCLRPILRTGPITLQPAGEGGWALARTPLLFCAENGLLLGPGSDRPWGAWELADPETGLGLPDSPALGLPGNRLHETRAALLFAGQLGAAFGGDPADLPPWQAALAAALLCHADGDGEGALRVLDALSTAWAPGAPPGRCPEAGRALARYGRAVPPGLGDLAALSGGRELEGGGPAFTDRGWIGDLDRRGELDRLAARHGLGDIAGLVPPPRRAPRIWPALPGGRPGRSALARHPELARHASYVNVWFTALLRLARRRGALPSSLWIWLRPTDRTLFYALNQLGGRAAWVEAAGVWSHYAAEERKGRPLSDPDVSSAVAGLASALRGEGWLPAAPRGGRGGTAGPGGAARPGTARDAPAAGEGAPAAGGVWGAAGGTGGWAGPAGDGSGGPDLPGGDGEGFELIGEFGGPGGAPVGLGGPGADRGADRAADRAADGAADGTAEGLAEGMADGMADGRSDGVTGGTTGGRDGRTADGRGGPCFDLSGLAALTEGMRPDPGAGAFPAAFGDPGAWEAFQARVSAGPDIGDLALGFDDGEGFADAGGTGGGDSLPGVQAETRVLRERRM
jgi:hypothetical protein